ncbi:hypothetical protein HCU74_01295 [Spongiibacter sp. KMU-166]|uniref:Frag1/DRAM/Sfk1 family protein n=1 Tax=Spongiibacter thalassae TaxID=2721624 RepID=A0ABX1GBR9_9GAMM|nr:hypothetical protein [Spongiibacter thalassae]NKI16043.1 hypothetical protein [Spongiibacter thalassae]
MTSTDIPLTSSNDVYVDDEKITIKGKKLSNTQLLHLACILTGIPFLIMLFGGSWAIADFIPAHSPSASAEVIAAFYRENVLAIRFGLALAFLGFSFILPIGSVIAAQTRRIEGVSPVLSNIQIASFSSGSLVFITTWICWLTAAFRPERDDQLIYLLNDLGWVFFVTTFIAYTVWNFAIGIAILFDNREEPIYPRWVGYFNVFVGVSFVPDICTPFFHTGPFAWDGIFTFYIPYFTFFIWVLVMMWSTSKAIINDKNLQSDNKDCLVDARAR